MSYKVLNKNVNSIVKFRRKSGSKVHGKILWIQAESKDYPAKACVLVGNKEMLIVNLDSCILHQVKILPNVMNTFGKIEKVC